MQIGEATLVYNEFKSSLQKKDITPAEAQFLVLAFHELAGQCPIINLKVTGEVKRTSQQELQRLATKYIKSHKDEKRVTLDKIWPGRNARLPERFDEVTDPDGNQVFDAKGTNLTKLDTNAPILIGGQSFTMEQLEALVAKNVKPIVKTDEELAAEESNSKLEIDQDVVLSNP